MTAKETAKKGGQKSSQVPIRVHSCHSWQKIFFAAWLLSLTAFLQAQPTTAPTISIDFSPRATDAPKNLTAAVARCGVAHPTDRALLYAALVPQRWLGAGKYGQPWGVSASESPALFWFSTKPTTAKLELLIVNTADNSVVRRIELNDELASGIQRLDLKKIGLKLARGLQYKWSIRYEGGPVSQAYLSILPTDDPRVAEITNSIGPAKATKSARLGVWYDMLESLCDAVDADPTNTALRDARLKCLDNQRVNLTISRWISQSAAAVQPPQH